MSDRPLACPEWQADLAAWLTAAISPDRERALEEHLAGCPRCRAEADSLHGLAAALLAAVPDAEPPGPEEPGPPADLEERIVQRVASERGRRRRVTLVLAAAGAGVVAALAVLAVVLTAGEAGPPDGTEVAFQVVPEGVSVEAVMVPDAGSTVVHLRADGLDPDLTYALWMSPPGGGVDDRVPAGTFRPDERGRVDAELRCAYPPSRYARVWATTPGGEVVLDTVSDDWADAD